MLGADNGDGTRPWLLVRSPQAGWIVRDDAFVSGVADERMGEVGNESISGNGGG